MELDMMFLKKTPPHSLEAERTVLGGILVQNENLNVVLSTISPEDLYKDAHRKILELIIGLVDKGLPVDLLTLTEDAQRAGILEEIGGASYSGHSARRRPAQPQRRVLRPDHQGKGPPPAADPVLDADHPGQLRPEGGRRRAAQRRPGGHRRGRRAAHQARLPPHQPADRADPGDDPRDGRRARRPSPACPPASATSTP